VEDGMVVRPHPVHTSVRTDIRYSHRMQSFCNPKKKPLECGTDNLETLRNIKRTSFPLLESQSKPRETRHKRTIPNVTQIGLKSKFRTSKRGLTGLGKSHFFGLGSVFAKVVFTMKNPPQSGCDLTGRRRRNVGCASKRIEICPQHSLTVQFNTLW